MSQPAGMSRAFFPTFIGSWDSPAKKRRPKRKSHPFASTGSENEGHRIDQPDAEASSCEERPAKALCLSPRALDCRIRSAWYWRGPNTGWTTPIELRVLVREPLGGSEFVQMARGLCPGLHLPEAVAIGSHVARRRGRLHPLEV